ncbi:nucleotidyltransferase family protein [Thermodesulfovibrio hydrogeniphilus]
MSKKSVQSLDDIIRVLREHKEEIKQKYKVKEIGVFGSFVRGEQNKRSDVDILVEYTEVPDLLKFIELENFLRHILGKKVDLVRKKGIRKELRERILEEVVYV